VDCSPSNMPFILIGIPVVLFLLAVAVAFADVLGEVDCSWFGHVPSQSVFAMTASVAMVTTWNFDLLSEDTAVPFK
jgi:hypothetical protein